MTDLSVIANIPKNIKIGKKSYPIKSPSIGTCAEVSKKLKTIQDALGFDPSKYDPKTVKIEELVGDILKGIYTSIINQDNDTIFNTATEIIALIINNAPLDAQKVKITPEQIKWEMELKDFTGLLAEVMRMSDLSSFFLLMLRMGQGLDVEGILSASPN